MKLEDSLITVIKAIPTVCVIAGPPALAHAGPEMPGHARIVGGELSKTCHFPNATYMSTGCTGTLVHPEIVTTAKHCVGRSATFSFGEKSSDKKLSVKATCKSWSGQGDMAYCKLSKPVTDVPIVPILMGCELEALNQKGLDVALVGYGRTSGSANDYGTKRQVFTPLHDKPGAGGGNVKDAEILVGHEEKGACNGDSGGPAYIDLRKVPGLKDKPGAGWRVFGVTSRPGPGAKVCLGTTVYGMIHKMVDWIEEDSGIDVTPCFDADGKWNPGENCKDFPDPEAGGSWDSCDPGKLSGYSHVCGENPNDPGGEGGESESESEGESESESESEGGDTESGGESGESEGGDKSGGEDSNGDKSKDDSDKKDDPDEKSSAPTPEDPSGEDDPTPDDEGSKNKSGNDSANQNGTKDPDEDRKGGCRVNDNGTRGLAGLFGLAFLVRLRRRKQRP